jgi:hypothetical protein
MSQDGRRATEDVESHGTMCLAGMLILPFQHDHLSSSALRHLSRILHNDVLTYKPTFPLTHGCRLNTTNEAKRDSPESTIPDRVGSPYVPFPFTSSYPVADRLIMDGW